MLVRLRRVVPGLAGVAQEDVVQPEQEELIAINPGKGPDEERDEGQLPTTLGVLALGGWEWAAWTRGGAG